MHNAMALIATKAGSALTKNIKADDEKNYMILIIYQGESIVIYTDK